MDERFIQIYLYWDPLYRQKSMISERRNIMLSREEIKTEKCFIDGKLTICEIFRELTIPTTKLEQQIVNFKYASINDAGEIDKSRMMRALPKGKQQRKFFLKFAMKMFPELFDGEAEISTLVPDNLDYICTALSMKKDPVRMVKWLKRHGVTACRYSDGYTEYSYFELHAE